MSLFKRQPSISFSKEMSGHPLFMWTRVVSLMLVFLSTTLILWKLWPAGAEQGMVSLHYNAFFGVDLLGVWYQALALPLLGLILYLANMLFARQVWEKEHLLSLLFAAGTIAAEIILFIAVLFIVLLNL